MNSGWKWCLRMLALKVLFVSVRVRHAFAGDFHTVHVKMEHHCASFDKQNYVLN